MPAGLPSGQLRLSCCGCAAWQAGLAPPVAGASSVAGSAAALHVCRCAWRPCPAWRGEGAHAKCSGGMPQAHGGGVAELIACACAWNLICMFRTQRCMHSAGWSGVGVCGRAWARAFFNWFLACVRVAHEQVGLRHSPLPRRPQPGPRVSEVPAGGCGVVARTFPRVPTWASR